MQGKELKNQNNNITTNGTGKIIKELRKEFSQQTSLVNIESDLSMKP